MRGGTVKLLFVELDLAQEDHYKHWAEAAEDRVEQSSDTVDKARCTFLMILPTPS